MNLRQLVKERNKKLLRSKKRFLKRTGKRIARGWKQTSGYRQIINWYNQRVKDIKEERVLQRERSKDPLQDFRVPEPGNIFWQVLSYGNGPRKSAMTIYDLFVMKNSRSVLGVASVCDGTSIGGTKNFGYDRFETDISIRTLFSECLDYQDEIENSSLPNVAVMTGTYNSVHYVVIKALSISEEKPEDNV